jgi:hypothetical protein
MSFMRKKVTLLKRRSTGLAASTSANLQPRVVALEEQLKPSVEWVDLASQVKLLEQEISLRRSRRSRCVRSSTPLRGAR